MIPRFLHVAAHGEIRMEAAITGAATNSGLFHGHSTEKLCANQRQSLQRVPPLWPPLPRNRHRRLSLIWTHVHTLRRHGSSASLALWWQNSIDQSLHPGRLRRFTTSNCSSHDLQRTAFDCWLLFGDSVGCAVFLGFRQCANGACHRAPPNEGTFRLNRLRRMWTTVAGSCISSVFITNTTSNSEIVLDFTCKLMTLISFAFVFVKKYQTPGSMLRGSLCCLVRYHRCHGHIQRFSSHCQRADERLRCNHYLPVSNLHLSSHGNDRWRICVEKLTPGSEANAYLKLV